MKRLFFLFVFIFIGFGAFGHIHNNSHFCAPNSQLFSLSEYSSRALYADTIPKKKRVDEWYLNRYTARMDLDIGMNHMMFKDNFISEMPFSGFGMNGGMSIEGFDTKYRSYLGIFLRNAWTQPTKNYRSITNFSLTEDHKINYSGFDSYIDISRRLGKTSHYTGVHANVNLYGGSYGLPIGGISYSIGLAHTYYARIFGIQARFNATLPLVIGYEANGITGGTPVTNSPLTVTNYFNPVVDTALFFNTKDRYIDIKLSYRFSYLNINREFTNYRHMVNAISLGISLSVL